MKNGKTSKIFSEKKELVPDAGVCFGLWAKIAVQPREKYFRLYNSKILQPVDNKQVWSIVCFFIHKDYRKRGVSVGLIKNACDFAASKGGTIVEAYPTETKTKNSAPVFIYTGTFAAFKKAGFEEVARRSETRPIMRKKLKIQK